MERVGVMGAVAWVGVGGVAVGLGVLDGLAVIVGRGVGVKVESRTAVLVAF